ncbi:PorT [Sphingobacterium rhinopitheci]|uniref:PorT n=1 Tax=Sphingobacterium rhinopitheci TaxID=2781960 RepID=UPI001F526B7C|nr:PorT [Sphingobacterium rhinopitheci]MCI0920051.1 PorT [Sphingobacterium rhinopitheci]
MSVFYLILIFLFFNIKGYTQQKISFPFSGYFDKNSTVSFGIQYNYVYQNFQLGLKNNWQQDYPLDYPIDNILYLGNLKSIRSKAGAGFSVGIPIDILMHRNIYLSTQPSFLFINNLGIIYESLDVEKETLIRKGKHEINTAKGTNFNAFEIPINIKLRSEDKYLKNKFDYYSVYFTTGIRYSKWIGLNQAYKNIANRKDQSLDPLIFKTSYISWEGGVGIDIYLDKFKISPEIKFNQSFNTVLDHKHTLSTNNKFMNPIEKALVRNIYVGLIFQ